MNHMSEFWFFLTVLFLILTSFFLGKRWVHGKRVVKNKTAFNISNAIGSVQKNKNLEVRDEIKNLLMIEPRAAHEEPVIYRFVGVSNILEMLAYIELWNKR